MKAYKGVLLPFFQKRKKAVAAVHRIAGFQILQRQEMCIRDRPLPVSVTSILKYISQSRTLTWMLPPAEVYFTALSRICLLYTSRCV